ncbi:diguanylate cyclase (GGDEF) domain-containing protein [Rhizobiales bacterium GAS113]|nr:diguanylate cyclase (GGDEF) domain-containing protein [Rhizobiales bacterium GAS113]
MQIPKMFMEQNPRKSTRSLIPTLVISSGILLFSILLQMIFAGRIDEPQSLFTILGAVQLIAFGVSAIVVLKMMGAIESATAELTGLAEPLPRSTEARDLVGRLLATPSRVANKIDSAAGDLERLKEIDPLTGLGNRWWLQMRAKQEFDRAQREANPISLILVKINGLDDINSQFGHHAGNTALLSVADTLRDFVRPYDLVGRVAADEFSVVLPGAPLSVATEIASRLQSAISSRRLALLDNRSVSASAAVVEPQAKDSWFEQFFELVAKR